MTTTNPPQMIGYLGVAGGALGLLLAPVMVTIKYMTGWAIVPQPAWVDFVRDRWGGLLDVASPAQLWTAFGSAYTVALVLMLIVVLRLRGVLATSVGRLQAVGYWVLVAGFCQVIPGDAIHSWTWHQDGLTVPTPGTNPLANTAYAVHMMGMNFIMAGSLMLGISALRRKTLTPWVAWSFALTLPAAILASLTLLPTTPSGALWLFSGLTCACGYYLATGRGERLLVA